MILKFAEYRIHPEVRSEVEDIVRTFVTAVRQAEPSTEYRAFARGDGVSFLHVMRFVDAVAEAAHREAAYTAAFVRELYPRCVEPPVFTDVIELGAKSEA